MNHAYDRNGKRMANGLGICGGHADLCHACHKFELAEVRAWAKDKPARGQAEAPAEYWHRIGGRFLDSWYQVAHEKGF